MDGVIARARRSLAYRRDRDRQRRARGVKD